jgi:hypothetical protein
VGFAKNFAHFLLQKEKRNHGIAFKSFMKMSSHFNPDEFHTFQFETDNNVEEHTRETVYTNSTNVPFDREHFEDFNLSSVMKEMDEGEENHKRSTIYSENRHRHISKNSQKEMIDDSMFFASEPVVTTRANKPRYTLNWWYIIGITMLGLYNIQIHIYIL